MELFHTVVIGGGPGGTKAAIELAKAGKKVALVSNELGGECLNWGCIPTKTFLWSAEVFSLLKKAKTFGIDAENVSYNFEQATKRRVHVVDLLSKGVALNLKTAGATVISGTGEILSEHQVKIHGEGVESTVLEAEYIVIATGSSPRWIRGTERSGNVLDNRSIFALEKAPSSLIIIGGGVIGCEFASFFATLGTPVVLIDRAERLLASEDSEISEALQKRFTKTGMEMHLQSAIEEVSECGDHVEVLLKKVNGEAVSLTADKLLMAVGRTPNIPKNNLNLQCSASGITTNESMQTSVQNVYAIGDAAGKALLAYTAEREAEAASAHILNKTFEAIDYGGVPNAIFTEPNISSIGMTEEVARAQGVDIVIAKSSYGGNGRALITNDREGFVKLIFAKSDKRLLGGHIFGFFATEFAPLLSMAVQKNLAHEDLKRIFFPHPIFCEVIKEAIEKARDL